MIYLVYAHEPEVKALKRLVKESDLERFIVWRRWRDDSDQLFDDTGPKPDFILNVGFAGRLNPKLALGEVVLVGDILDDQDIAPVPFRPAQRFADAGNISRAVLITSKAPVVDKAADIDPRARAQADIVDMEAGHLFNRAAQANIPFVSFKLISDNADAGAWDIIKQYRGEWSERLGLVVNGFLAYWGHDTNSSTTEN